MKILKTLPAIAGILFAQSVSVRGPELTMSGSTISHARTDGNIHVPRSFGVPDGYQLTTHGGSGDAYWAAPGGAFVDSARAARKADTANYAAVAGRSDSSRVAGLSDSAKALVRYARTTAVHDTADTLRKYTRDRIKDSLVSIRAALPAYVRRIGDTITGPITGTTATAAPLINITTTFGNLTNAAIRGTASAAGGAAIHGIATGAHGAAIWGVSSNTGGDGGLFSGTGGANAVRAIATGGGKAGLFQGDVEVVGATKLASSLTGILKANAGVVSVADTSDFPTRPYLPIAAGSGSPLTGVLYGQGLNFTTTANAPITISQNLAGGFTHPFQAFNSGMVAGNQYNFDFGQSASTNNAGNFGFKYLGAGSSSNYVTLGLYGANDLLTITAAGVPKFSGLTASKFVKTDASKNLVSTDVAYSDLTGVVPTWNQSTTGSAATLTTSRGISMTGDGTWSVSFNGGSNVSGGMTLTSIITAGSAGSTSQVPVVTWDAKGRLTAVSSATITPAAIGAAPAHAVGTNVVLKSNGSGGFAASTATDDGTTFATAGRLGWSGGTWRDLTSNPSIYTAAYASGVTTPGGTNYSLALRKDGVESWLNGTTSSNLAVNSAPIATASSSGLAVTGTLSATSTLSWGGAAAIASSDYVVQGNGVGTLGHRTTNLGSVSTIPATQSGFADVTAGDGPQGAVLSHLIRNMHQGGATSNWWSLDIAAPFAGTSGGTEAYYVRLVSNGSTPGWRQLWHTGNLTSSTLPGGPYLPLAGGTVTGYTNFTNDIGTQRQFVGNGDVFVRSGAVLLRVGDGNDWSTAAVQFPSTSTTQSFRVDGGAQFNSAVQFTAGAVHGASKQIATHLYSVSSTLPALAQGEWCWVVMDQSSGGSTYWTTPATRSLRYYAGGTTTTLVPASTTMSVPNNGTA